MKIKSLKDAQEFLENLEGEEFSFKDEKVLVPGSRINYTKISYDQQKNQLSYFSYGTNWQDQEVSYTWHIRPAQWVYRNRKSINKALSNLF